MKKGVVFSESKTALVHEISSPVLHESWHDSLKQGKFLRGFAAGMAAPQIGREYAVDLGETFLSTHPAASYHSLAYKFKPQSATRSRPGSIHLDEHGVVLQMANREGGQAAVDFEGQWTPSQQGLDCVAIFDGKRWRLELLDGAATNIRHVAGPAGTAAPRPSLSPPPSSPPRQVSTSEITGMEDGDDDFAAALEAEFEEEQDAPSVTPSITPLADTPQGSLSPELAPAQPEVIAGAQELMPAAASAGTAQTFGADVDMLAGGAEGTPEPKSPSAETGSKGAQSSPPVPERDDFSDSSTSSSSSSSSDDGESEAAQPATSLQPGRRGSPTHAAPNAAGAAAEVPDGEVPDFEREFFAGQASGSDASSSSDDEDLNKCSDDNSDDGIGHF